MREGGLHLRGDALQQRIGSHARSERNGTRAVDLFRGALPFLPIGKLGGERGQHSYAVLDLRIALVEFFIRQRSPGGEIKLVCAEEETGAVRGIMGIGYRADLVKHGGAFFGGEGFERV